MAAPSSGDDQPLVGFMTNDEWDALLADVNALVKQMESLPRGETRDNVFRLLDGVDLMHREALRRLVRLFKEGVLEKVISDPAIHTLLELYDLLPEPASAALAKPSFPTIPIRAVATAPPPLPVRYPHWVPVLAQSDSLPSGGLRDDLAMDGLPLLLARRDDQWFALDAVCPVDGVSLQGASLSGYTLTCPKHAGCHYDIRTGARVGGGAGLACHPVKADERGRILVGLDMDFKASLPSF